MLPSKVCQPHSCVIHSSLDNIVSPLSRTLASGYVHDLLQRLRVVSLVDLHLALVVVAEVLLPFLALEAEEVEGAAEVHSCLCN